jgi:hypothetical protein
MAWPPALPSNADACVGAPVISTWVWVGGRREGLDFLARGLGLQCPALAVYLFDGWTSEFQLRVSWDCWQLFNND